MPTSHAQARDGLADRWGRLVVTLELPEDRAETGFDQLVARYEEPHRHYHTLAHVTQVLDDLDALIEAGEVGEEPDALRLAAWFHDAVYDPKADDNERRSADLVAAWFGAALGPVRLRRVTEAIVSTVHKEVPPAAAAALVDADLAILSAPWPAYRRYAAAIRREYAHVPDRAFRRGRAAILESLLERPSVYVTSTMRRHGEHTARRNLRRELRALSGGDTAATQPRAGA